MESQIEIIKQPLEPEDKQSYKASQAAIHPIQPYQPASQ